MQVRAFVNCTATLVFNFKEAHFKLYIFFKNKQNNIRLLKIYKTKQADTHTL